VLLAYIYWDVTPHIVRLGSFEIRWYGLIFATAFLLGFGIMRSIYQREGKPVSDLDSLLIYMLAGTIIGARLGHCFFYDPSYYLSNPEAILQIWKGGLASHGGAVGILTSIYLFSRRRRDRSYVWLLDRIAIPTALGGTLIRLGNLFNSEILGRPTDVDWAFIFARIDNHPRHPAQLYESFSYLVIFIMLMTIYRRKGPELPKGLLTGVFLVSVFSARIGIEFIKVRQAAFSEDMALSMGQLLSIPMVLLGAVIIVLAIRGKNKSSSVHNVS